MSLWIFSSRKGRRKRGKFLKQLSHLKCDFHFNIDLHLSLAAVTLELRWRRVSIQHIRSSGNKRFERSFHRSLHFPQTWNGWGWRSRALSHCHVDYRLQYRQDILNFWLISKETLYRYELIHIHICLASFPGTEGLINKLNDVIKREQIRILARETCFFNGILDKSQCCLFVEYSSAMSSSPKRIIKGYKYLIGKDLKTR